MSYTKGPWEVGNADNCARRHAVTKQSQVIARVSGNGFPIGIGWSPETAANARLIAVSPDLLEALEAAVPYLIRLGDFIGNGEGEAPTGRCEVIGRAKDAIAKATKGE